MWGSQCGGRSIGGEHRKTVPDEQINARTETQVSRVTAYVDLSLQGEDGTT